MRKCHGRELWRERKKEAGYEDGLILSCGPSYTEMEFLNGFFSRGYGK
jgi:hypothetical protein